jgi:hypothetical protein
MHQLNRIRYSIAGPDQDFRPVQCGESDEQHALEVGDAPGHSLMISKGKCTWTKPIEIAGTLNKEDAGTNFDEIHGNKSQGTATSSVLWPMATPC